MKLRNLIPLSMVLLSGPLAAQSTAQPAAPRQIDRILALVGDSIIFEAEVNEQVDQVRGIMQSRGEKPPTDSAGIARIRSDILNEMIDRLILVQAALRDSAMIAQIAP